MVKGKFKVIPANLGHIKAGESAHLVSNFLITMNTNVRVPANDRERVSREYIPALEEAAQRLFSDEEDLQKFVVFGRPKHKEKGGRSYGFVPDPSIQWSDDTVVNFESMAHVEVGHNKQGQRLHLHVALKIRHHSRIRIDGIRLQEMANDVLKELGFPFTIKYTHISTSPPTPEDYLTK